MADEKEAAKEIQEAAPESSFIPCVKIKLGNGTILAYTAFSSTGKKVQENRSVVPIFGHQMKPYISALVCAAALFLLAGATISAQSRPAVTEDRMAEHKEIALPIKDLDTAPKNVTLTGRVVSTFGVGLHGVWVTLDNGTTEPRKVLTDGFGNFAFDDVAEGGGYLLMLETDRYRFDGQSKFVVVKKEPKEIQFVIEF